MRRSLVKCLGEGQRIKYGRSVQLVISPETVTCMKDDVAVSDHSLDVMFASGKVREERDRSLCKEKPSGKGCPKNNLSISLQFKRTNFSEIKKKQGAQVNRPVLFKK